MGRGEQNILITRRSGFTLIELAVVILIIVVVSSMVIPSFNGFYREERFRHQGRVLMSFLLQARQEAAEREEIVTVQYNPYARQLFMLGEPGGFPDGETGPPPLGRTRALPDDIVLAVRSRAQGREDGPDRPHVLRFYPDGHSDGGALLLRHETGRLLSVAVTPNTGRAHLIDADRGAEIN
ncbi:MAG: prepilin-type N-terminal cleavage/methylation domain-containing protein [Armatimonadetes bacterium]|nr:prepilin-type N-terminal cleavage/methylation domain-containing protein [Armatimonadota bacterium]